eukprot:768665-Hanusia_phi.AAC.1
MAAPASDGEQRSRREASARGECKRRESNSSFEQRVKERNIEKQPPSQLTIPLQIPRPRNPPDNATYGEYHIGTAVIFRDVHGHEQVGVIKQMKGS